MTRTVVHPARWNSDVLEALIPTLRAWALPIHDPFAGTGERLAALAARLDLGFTGTELQPGWVVNPRVRQGDSTEARSYPRWPHCVVTSPVFPNGMTDHFKAQDESKRNTYRQCYAETVGHDEPLHGRNMARYGPRQGKKSALAYWTLAAQCVRHWPDHVLLNMKDCILGQDVVYPAIGKWVALLQRADYEISNVERIVTPGLPEGANGDARLGYEVIVTAIKER